MQSTTTIKGIHCKVSTQDQIRRFFVSSAEYNALAEQISQLFGFANDSIVLKYTDDEGDSITISSDAELAFAIDISKATLRLTVDRLNVQPSAPHQGECAKKWRKRHDKSRRDPVDHKKNHLSKFTQKHERLANKLARLESLPPNHHARECIPKVQSKMQCISARIARLDGMKQEKCETSHSALPDSELTTKIEDLKNQVPGLREAVNQSRLQLKLRRECLHANKGDRPQNFEELKTALALAKQNESSQNLVLRNVLQLLKPLQQQHKIEACRAKAERKKACIANKEARRAAKMERKCNKAQM